MDAKKKKELKEEIIGLLKKPHRLLPNTKGEVPIGILWEEVYKSVENFKDMKELIRELLRDESIEFVGPCIEIKGYTIPRPGKNLANLLHYVDTKGISLVFDTVKIKEEVSYA